MRPERVAIVGAADEVFMTEVQSEPSVELLLFVFRSSHPADPILKTDRRFGAFRKIGHRLAVGLVVLVFWKRPFTYPLNRTADTILPKWQTNFTEFCQGSK